MSDYRLSELNTFIRRFVALNLPEPVWVEAELAEVDERRGHYYLSLIETAGDSDQTVARAQAIMWDRQARKWQRQRQLLLHRILQAGRAIKLQVQVEFHERYGISMQVVDLDPNYTLGLLAQQREATLELLKSLGLLEANKRVPLPMVPQRLAVISSPVAAGLQDFTTQLKQNAYGYEFRTQLFPAAVQGPQTSPEVRRQLRTIQRRAEDYDAIVIIRGGGAKMDLADFDERALCEAAAQSSLPIITGIGHETDQSIMDMLAHTALKTPTAAADFFVDRLLQVDQHLALASQQLRRLQEQHIRQAEQVLVHIESSIKSQIQQQLQGQEWQLRHMQQQLPIFVRNRLKLAERALEEQIKLHEVLSLESHLKRGFTVLTQEGKIINRIASIRKDVPLEAQLADGSTALTIKSPQKKK